MVIEEQNNKVTGTQKRTSSRKTSNERKDIDLSGKENLKNVARPKKEEFFSRGKTCKSTPSCCDSSGAIYFLGFIGALIYYISSSIGFWATVVSVLKATIWPTMLILKLLGM